MPTEKPRFTVTMDEGLFEQIENFKFNGRYKNQTKAVIALIEKGLEVISAEDPEAAEAIKNPPAAPGEDHMISLYRELNQEGQEKLLDYADDLVASGKYIKSDQNNLGTAKNA